MAGYKIDAIWRLRNMLNLAPAYIYRNRLRALEAFVGRETIAEFHVSRAFRLWSAT